jgi:hypothetical protein
MVEVKQCAFLLNSCIYVACLALRMPHCVDLGYGKSMVM